MSDTETRLGELFGEKLNRRVQPHECLAELELDSLALAELSVAIEQAFGVKLGERVYEVQSLHEFAALIDELRASPKQ